MTRSQRNKKQYETKDDNEMIGIQENVIYIYIYIYIWDQGWYCSDWNPKKH